MHMKYDNEFKARVAQEAIDTNNISATAKKNGVNTNTVRKWKKELEKKLGMGEIQNITELEAEKDIALLKREILELKKRLEVTLKDLNVAMTILGEKDLVIKKLERS